MSDWNQYRADSEHTGRRRKFETPSRPDAVWDIEVTDPHVSEPVLERDTIYLGSRRGTVYAFDRHTGHRRWTAEHTSPITASPVAADGAVVVAASDGTVLALEADSGEKRWVESVSGGVDAAPTVSGSTLFVAHSAGVSALEVTDGTQRWFHETETEPVCAPATADGTTIAAEHVYVGVDGNELLALEIETGEQAWSTPTKGSVVGGPSIVTDVVPTASNGGIEGVDERVAASDSSTATASDRVYTADDGGLLLALDAETGQSWFTYEIRDSFTTTPIVVDDSVFVAASDGYLHVTDTTFGKRKLRGWLFAKKGIDLDGVGTAAPGLAGERLCLGDSRGSLYGIDVSDPDFAWHLPLDAGVSSGPIIADDALYLVTDDDRLRCLSWRAEAANWF